MLQKDWAAADEARLELARKGIDTECLEKEQEMESNDTNDEKL